MFYPVLLLIFLLIQSISQQQIFSECSLIPMILQTLSHTTFLRHVACCDSNVCKFHFHTVHVHFDGGAITLGFCHQYVFLALWICQRTLNRLEQQSYGGFSNPTLRPISSRVFFSLAVDLFHFPPFHNVMTLTVATIIQQNKKGLMINDFCVGHRKLHCSSPWFKML